MTASIMSSVLWILAGRIGIVTNNFYSFTIIGVLAALLMMVAITSARKEGFYGRRLMDLTVRKEFLGDDGDS